VTIRSINTKSGTQTVASYIMYSAETSSQLSVDAHVP
jgi:hypothetical protein